MTGARTRLARWVGLPIQRSTRPWGEFDVAVEGSGFRVKRIRVRPDQRLSYQRHASRSEHWVVVRGVGRATLDGAERSVRPGTSVNIAVGVAHRMANVGETDLVFIEVQTGSYLGEDDIERLADDYGRASGAADVAS